MSRSCPNGEFCRNEHCMATSPKCRSRRDPPKCRIGGEDFHCRVVENFCETCGTDVTPKSTHSQYSKPK